MATLYIGEYSSAGPTKWAIIDTHEYDDPLALARAVAAADAIDVLWRYLPDDARAEAMRLMRDGLTRADAESDREWQYLGCIREAVAAERARN